MAEGIRKRTGATLGVGVTGIAGPTGGTESKPVGLVYFAVSDPQKTDSFNRDFSRGSRPHAAMGGATGTGSYSQEADVDCTLPLQRSAALSLRN